MIDTSELDFQPIAGAPDPSHPFLAAINKNKAYTNSVSSFASQTQSQKQRYSGEREELDSESGYEYEEDEMAELSDSYSSIHTSSRPVTPSHPAQTAPVHISKHTSPQSRARSHGRTDSKAASAGDSPQSRSSPLPGVGVGGGEVFALAHKAERILGLTPGTLAHARACLENAKDQVRRTGTSSGSPTPEPLDSATSLIANPTNGNGNGNWGGNKGMVNRMQTRARKAMSVAGFPLAANSGAGAKVPGVVIGAGGKEEEDRRERRRRAADGVIYWQREVERMEREQREMSQGQKGNGTVKRR